MEFSTCTLPTMMLGRFRGFNISNVLFFLQLKTELRASANWFILWFAVSKSKCRPGVSAPSVRILGMLDRFGKVSKEPYLIVVKLKKYFPGKNVLQIMVSKSKSTCIERSVRQEKSKCLQFVITSLDHLVSCVWNVKHLLKIFDRVQVHMG